MALSQPNISPNGIWTDFSVYLKFVYPLEIIFCTFCTFRKGVDKAMKIARGWICESVIWWNLWESLKNELVPVMWKAEKRTGKPWWMGKDGTRHFRCKVSSFHLLQKWFILNPGLHALKILLLLKYTLTMGTHVWYRPYHHEWLWLCANFHSCSYCMFKDQ